VSHPPGLSLPMVLLLLTFYAGPAAAGTGQWTPIGPFEGVMRLWPLIPARRSRSRGDFNDAGADAQVLYTP
jgi:hypothetical protein